AAEIPHILDFVEKHKDYRSYHLLFALRRHQLEAYKKIAPEVRAAILCSMLKEMTFFNDWCDPSNRIVDPRDISEAEKALLEIGRPAIKYLLPLLGDQRFVDLNDEEGPSDCDYQVADFAFRYCSWILEIPYEFEVDRTDQDRQIRSLRRQLSN